MSLQVAERTELEEFERFAAELRIDGKPFSLYPEQLEIVEPYFDGVRETIVILPKKNGKSTLVSAAIIYHLLTTPDAECIVVAASRDQAEIILGQARKFIGNTPGLQKHLKVLRREIHRLEDSGRARVLASDEDTADGVLPTLAIVDELHRHKTSELYAVLRLAIGTTGGRMITISTAGSSMNTPLGEKRNAAYKMAGFTRDKKARRSSVRAPDGSFAFLEWCLNADDDPNDMSLVKLVNPAPWKTLELLAEEQPTVTPYQWLRFACGIWTEGEEPWIDPPLWDDQGDGEPPREKENIWAAVAIGNRDEESAVLTVARRDGHLFIGARIFEPATELEDLEEEIRTLRKTQRLMSVSFDPRQFARSAEMLSKEGLLMAEFPMTHERMAKASATLWRLLERKELHHDGNEQLRAHVLAGVVKEDVRGWQVTRDPRARRSVEGLMALMMAVQAASDQPDRKPMMAWA